MQTRLVRMTRGEQFADIHPDMVEDCRRFGWVPCMSVDSAPRQTMGLDALTPLNLHPRTIAALRDAGYTTMSEIASADIQDLLDLWGVHDNNIDAILDIARS